MKSSKARIRKLSKQIIVIIMMVAVFGSTIGVTAQAADARETSIVLSAEATTWPQLALIGDEEMSATLGQEFDDPGAHIINKNGREDKSKSKQIKVSGEVDTSKLGSYCLTYTWGKQQVSRVVNVNRISFTINGQLFFLTLNSPSDISVTVSEEPFEIPGFTVTNEIGNRYPQIEQLVSIKGYVNAKEVGDYQLTYGIGENSIPLTVHVTKVGDTAETDISDEAEKEDTTETVKRTETLRTLGTSKMRVKNGEIFTDPGAAVYQNGKPYKQDEVLVIGTVNTSVDGEYTLIYIYEGQMVKRTVIVGNLPIGNTSSSYSSSSSGGESNTTPSDPSHDDNDTPTPPPVPGTPGEGTPPEPPSTGGD